MKIHENKNCFLKRANSHTKVLCKSFSSFICDSQNLGEENISKVHQKLSKQLWYTHLIFLAAKKEQAIDTYTNKGDSLKLYFTEKK